MKYLPIVATVAGSLLFAACVPESTMPSPEPSSLWYVDADGDGFGDENDSGTASTNQPAGYVGNNTDCDDNASTGAAISPNATEVNTDLIDHDCDGSWSAAPFTVGDYGPAGGIVFDTDGTNGLEAAPNDQGGGSGAEWGCRNVDVGADSSTNGAQNTTALLAASCTSITAHNSVAVDLVNAYTLNGYDDWFLPSKEDLHTLYSQKNLVGGFAAEWYWSSSEYSASNAMAVNLSYDGENNFGKHNLCRVRSVRAF